MNKLLLITDAWHPQINGVVNTLNNMIEMSSDNNFDVEVISHQSFKYSFALPFYKEIRISFPSQKQVRDIIENHSPEYIHIATEGPIGNAFRKWCVKNKKKFTTSYHTKFPEFINAQFGIPSFMTFWWFKRFHNSGNGVFVATKSLANDLTNRGFSNIISWTRGVDTKLFKPILRPKNKIKKYLYVGRVSKEKNIEAFLDLDINGEKIVIGDGPILERLKKKYPFVSFYGKKLGNDLAHAYAMADYFVFPSKSDTFGIVILEALASGLPVISYPVTGPIDILEEGKTGSMNENLNVAVYNAKYCNSEYCVSIAQNYSWENTAKQFYSQLIKM
jgi:glycosyltransferase involved in cell wall biosynthesis